MGLRHSRRPQVIARLVALAILMSLSLASCGDAERATADDAVRTFHQRYTAGEFQAIYKDATEQFRNATREGDWVDMLEAIRRKAGGVASSTQTSWRIDTGTAGTTASVVYSTKFENLTAVEGFAWRIRSGNATLLGYRIDSPELVRHDWVPPP